MPGGVLASSTAQGPAAAAEACRADRHPQSGSPAMSTVTLGPDYGYVVAAAGIVSLHYMMIGGRIGTLRKKWFGSDVRRRRAGNRVRRHVGFCFSAHSRRHAPRAIHALHTQEFAAKAEVKDMSDRSKKLVGSRAS